MKIDIQELIEWIDSQKYNSTDNAMEDAFDAGLEHVAAYLECLLVGDGDM